MKSATQPQSLLRNMASSMQAMSTEIHNLQNQLRLLAAEMARTNAPPQPTVDQALHRLPLVGSLSSLFSDEHLQETLRIVLSRPDYAADWASLSGTSVSHAEDISIVMPVYNHERTVAEAIESVLNQQTKYTYVIYCIDDASTDSSARILTGYAAQQPDKIKIFTNPENLGSGKRSLYQQKPPIRGKYWCFLEGDDYWTTRDKLQKQVEFLETHHEYTGCCGHTVVRNETNGEESYVRPNVHEWNFLDLLIHRNKHSFYVHTSSIIWRNIYLNHGFFLPPAFENPLVGGDVFLHHLMLSAGGKMRLLPEVVSCYRITGQGIWTRKPPQEQAALNKALFENIDTLLADQFASLLNYHRIKNLIPSPVNS